MFEHDIAEIPFGALLAAGFLVYLAKETEVSRADMLQVCYVIDISYTSS